MAKFLTKLLKPLFSSAPPGPRPTVIYYKEAFTGTIFQSLQEMILNRVPHTLVRGRTTKLNIPGIEQRKETENALTIFVDLNGNNAQLIGVLSDLTVQSNAVFFKSYVTKNDFTTTYNCRINVEKNVYKTIHTNIVNGGVMLTLHKDFHKTDPPLPKNIIPTHNTDAPGPSNIIPIPIKITKTSSIPTV